MSIVSNQVTLYTTIGQTGQDFYPGEPKASIRPKNPYTVIACNIINVENVQLMSISTY